VNEVVTEVVLSIPVPYKNTCMCIQSHMFMHMVRIISKGAINESA
jgi:hypothetical protein